MKADPYMANAASEFLDGGNGSSSSLAPMGATSLDWGGALDTLRDRVDDIESGKSGPSNALFRLMAAETPNQTIGKFVQEADPTVVSAMSGAVGSLLGGLSNPSMGVEVVVKASGEKLGNLCFQLMMTGYLFRNAEYVLALRDLVGLKGSASVAEYRKAFDKIDSDSSGYIETNEIEDLLREVYGDEVPPFEVSAFLEFFDSNKDGRIEWKEFERGLGGTSAKKSNDESISSADDDDDDDDDDYPDFEQLFGEPSVEGKVQVELKNGKIIEVEAEQYMQSLKEEAEALKESLRMERGEPKASGGGGAPGGLVPGVPASSGSMGGIAGYIASLQGDLTSLTSGINPETISTMKLLIKFVLEGGSKKQKMADPDDEMELPGSALQQLALWQLVLGYRLRENEANGEYKKLLDS
jgi:Ca2+-binding EF-hand superfamily protein